MKNKNKIIALFLGGTFIFTMASCSKNKTQKIDLTSDITSQTKYLDDENSISINNEKQETTIVLSDKKQDDSVSTKNNESEITKYNINRIDSKCVYTNSSVNFRKEPNLDSDIIEMIGPYQKLSVIDNQNDFLYVSYDGTKGYVYKEYTNEIAGTYVEVDISDQNLYLYVDDELVMRSNVVTGNKSTHDTPLGCYSIYDKQKDTYLSGSDYKVHVENWIPFYGGYGLHDAEEWRSNYSSDQYMGNGSHGCINMKLNDANKLYDNVTKGQTKVLIHE